MRQLSTTDRYETPANTPRRVSDYLLLGSRWDLYLRFGMVVYRSRRLALEGVYDNEAWVDSSLEIVRDIEGTGGRFLIEGLDNIRNSTGPVVFVSNHMSTLETLTLPGIIAPIKPVTFVVKESLARGPAFGPIMKSRDPILVTRKDPRRDLEAVLTRGPELIAQGTSIIIFPQGTRVQVFEPSGFNSLGVKLAVKAGAPVIPIALKTDFWEGGTVIRGFGPVRRKRRIHIRFGEQIVVEGRGKKEHEQVVSFITGNLARWAQEEGA